MDDFFSALPKLIGMLFWIIPVVAFFRKKSAAKATRKQPTQMDYRMLTSELSAIRDKKALLGKTGEAQRLILERYASFASESRNAESAAATPVSTHPPHVEHAPTSKAHVSQVAAHQSTVSARESRLPTVRRTTTAAVPRASDARREHDAQRPRPLTSIAQSAPETAPSALNATQGIAYPQMTPAQAMLLGDVLNRPRALQPWQPRA